MKIPTVLPTLGEPVSTALLNLEALEDASFGEILHAATLLARIGTQRIADPQTYHEVATFADAGGADWSGLQGTPPTQDLREEQQEDFPSIDAVDEKTQSPPAPPVAPDNYCDTLPAIGHMLTQLARFQEASLTHYSRYLEASMKDQRSYLGTPFKESHFKDPAQYLVETMRLSRHAARRVVRRGVYFAHRPGVHGQKDAQPIFKGLAKSLAAGRLPVENADKIMALDEDLTKYSQKTNQPVERKDQVLQVFEPTMVEAGEAATPDELSKAKHRWLNHTAHWVCPNGPSPARAMTKEADNELRMREHSDGSATYSMHATADASASFKNFMLHQLNFNGTPVKISDKVLNLLTIFKEAKGTRNTAESPGTATSASDNAPQLDDSAHEEGAFGSDEGAVQETAAEARAEGPGDNDQEKHSLGEILGPIDTWDTQPALDDTVAEDAHREPVTAREIDRLDHMTTGQRLGTILISLFYNLTSIDPAVLGAKKAHGASAQLMIVQDIETAYHTLGVEKIPEAARRSRGPDGLQPSVIKRPNPHNPDAHFWENRSGDPERDSSDLIEQPRGVTSTPYQSEAVNIGPIHPRDAEILTCNSELVGQIWDGPDTVLQQKRAQRLFTVAQRRAILARDKGCQAPGCTMPAINCAIHHIKEWLEGGHTDETNAVTLCPRHHAAVHNGKWAIRRHEGLIFFQPAPWLDPTQPLLRNVYWNT